MSAFKGTKEELHQNLFGSKLIYNIIIVVFASEYDALFGGDCRTAERASLCELLVGTKSLFHAHVYHI